MGIIEGLGLLEIIGRLGSTEGIIVWGVIENDMETAIPTRVRVAILSPQTTSPPRIPLDLLKLCTSYSLNS